MSRRIEEKIEADVAAPLRARAPPSEQTLQRIEHKLSGLRQMVDDALASLRRKTRHGDVVDRAMGALREQSPYRSSRVMAGIGWLKNRAGGPTGARSAMPPALRGRGSVQYRREANAASKDASNSSRSDAFSEGRTGAGSGVRHVPPPKAGVSPPDVSPPIHAQLRSIAWPRRNKDKNAPDEGQENPPIRPPGPNLFRKTVGADNARAHARRRKIAREGARSAGAATRSRKKLESLRATARTAYAEHADRGDPRGPVEAAPSPRARSPYREPARKAQRKPYETICRERAEHGLRRSRRMGPRALRRGPRMGA